MIDFISTHPGATPQTKACANLLAAVIAEAVRDASEPLSSEERKGEVNRNVAARQALRFLFDRTTVFSAYARLIGLTADSIRRGLMLPAQGTDLGYFNDTRRRTLQTRLGFSEFVA